MLVLSVRLGLLACATPLQLVAMGGPSAAVDPLTALIRCPSAGPIGIALAARGHLWLVDRRAGTARRLTGRNGFEFAPHFSADGRRVAYPTDVGGEKQLALRLADGGTHPFQLRLPVRAGMVAGRPVAISKPPYDQHWRKQS